MNLAKNIRTYYFYSTFASLLILGPIIVLYYLAKGLSFTQIMIIQSVASVSIFVFEVPTGAVADKFGRKLSMILGSILWAISLWMYIVGPGFVVFLAAEVVFSLGLALRSGADSALIYDTLKNSGEEKRFQEIEGKAQSLALYAQAIGSILAGFLYEINIHLPLIVSCGFMIITIIITTYFTEPTHEKGNENSVERQLKYLEQIKAAGKYVMGHEKVKAVIFFSIVFYVFYRNGFWFFQPYMEAVNIPVKYFGIIFFLFNMTAALTAGNVHLVMEKTKPRTLTFMAGLLLISFIILGTVKIWIGVFAILFQQAARGMYRPVTRKYLNKHIPSEQRATILSFQSLATNLAVALTAPLIGLLKDANNIFTCHLILAIMMATLMILVFRYMNRRLGLNYKKISKILS